MRPTRAIKTIIAPAALAILLSACSAQTKTTTVEGVSAHDGTRYNNLLVIGVANDFEGRALFERELSTNLKKSGIAATAMYTVAGGNKPIVREDVEALVSDKGYDAVLISRVLDRDAEVSLKTGAAGAKATRKDGRPINLFRYDYEELNEPAALSAGMSIVIATELFAVGNSEKVWAVRVDISEQESLNEMIVEAADSISSQLSKDRMIGN